MPESKEGGAREIPRHLGAVFVGSIVAPSAYDYVSQEYIVPQRHIEKPQDRELWALENIKVFSDGTMASPEFSWYPVIKQWWIPDLKTAAHKYLDSIKDESQAGKFEEDIDRFEDRIKAMMSVSASARAMERSSAVPDVYLGLITYSPEKPDSNAQDYMGTFLLHDHPENYLAVIKEGENGENALVAHYYKQVLEDAHLVTKIPEPLAHGDDDAEWHRDPREPENWHCSRVLITAQTPIGLEIRDIRDKGKKSEESLIYYLCKKAKNGGFDAYIRNRLLKKDSLEELKKIFGGTTPSGTVKWAAAKLACDAFLVDKFTRWNFQLTSIDEKGNIKSEKKIYGDKLDIAPKKDWGGDPFTNIIQPSFLPRIIKQVYEGKEAARILDMVDVGFRPDDIFYNTQAKFDPQDILHPTAVENVKKLIRYNEALGLFFGSSRAAALPEYNMGVLKDSLNRIAELLAQIYPKDKHLLGAMVSRLILAKASAARASMVNSPYFVDIFGPLTDPRGREPLREFREALFGTNLDWRRGLVADLASRRTEFVFRGNKYGAEEVVTLAYRTLATPEEGFLRKAGRGIVVVSNAFTQKR